LADKKRTDTDDIKFLRRKIGGAFTDEVRDHNILINLDILNINKKNERPVGMNSLRSDGHDMT
jgi:hypothetical protein